MHPNIMEIVIDTSALLAVIADEPEANMVLEYSKLTDEVIIKNNDGNNYKLLPIKQLSKTPFDNIPRVKLGITTQEIVETIRECRAGI